MSPETRKLFWTVTWTSSWKPTCDNRHELTVKKIAQILLTRENLFALLLCLILIALLIFTADTSPTWIYQGF
jgi:hypothetical protein